LKKVLVIFFIGLISWQVKSQEETHFSQFSDALVMFNPATSGIFHGSVRFNGHYRTQWGKSGQPYKTMAAAVDLPVLTEVTGNDFLALGLYGIKDDAGLSQTSTFNGGLNLNFGKSFDPQESHFWAMGAKLTYNQKRMNNSSDLNWGSQWDTDNGSGWDPNRAPGMAIGEVSKTYIGFGAGFHHFWSNHQNVRTLFGVAMNNINRPKVEYLNQEYQLRSSTMIHGEVEIHSHADNIALIPRAAMLFQGSQRYFIIGTSVDFLLKQAGKTTGYVKEATIEFGGFYRWKDALVAEVQMNWAGLGVGFSYDLPVSKIGQSVNYVGALEFLLHYKLGYKSGLKSKHSSHRFDTIH
jgi:type IX secretion system PorP/SprF family membrane protein